MYSFILVSVVILARFIVRIIIEVMYDRVYSMIFQFKTLPHT